MANSHKLLSIAWSIMLHIEPHHVLCFPSCLFYFSFFLFDSIRWSNIWVCTRFYCENPIDCGCHFIILYRADGRQSGCIYAECREVCWELISMVRRAHHMCSSCCFNKQIWINCDLNFRRMTMVLYSLDSRLEFEWENVLCNDHYVMRSRIVQLNWMEFVGLHEIVLRVIFSRVWEQPSYFYFQ